MTIDLDLKDTTLDKKVKLPKVKGERRPKRKESVIQPLTEEEKKKRKKKRTRIIIIVILIITVFGLGFLLYKGYIFSKEFGFRFQNSSLLSSEKKELKKDPSGRFTNALLVGFDTRENGGLLNTDTIILASYDHQTGNIILFSIPRDFHVEESNNKNWFTKINGIYSSAEGKEKGSGIIALRSSIENLTGKEIQYHAMVDFKAFVEIIDAVGGVDVNVENSFTDYMYPNGHGYKTVSFSAGPQTMDGQTALIYSRSRHSINNNEGSDFARARRQQNVIAALKEKIINDDSLKNPKTLMGILTSIMGNISISEFTITDIEAATKLIKKYEEKEGDIYSFVLDPTVGGFSLVETKSMLDGAYAIAPKLGFGKYEDIHNFVSLAYQYPEIYSEKARILVYDTGLGFQKSKEKTEELLEQFPYLNITFSGTMYKDKEGIIVYTKNDEPSKTAEELAKILNANSNKKPVFITTNLNGEDVTILLGKNLELIEE